MRRQFVVPSIVLAVVLSVALVGTYVVSHLHSQPGTHPQHATPERAAPKT